MNIKEMKARRDDLHKELKDYLITVKPKEQEIRAEIKDLQQELYRREMTPVIAKLKHDVAEGLLEGDKLEAAKKKIALVEPMLAG